MILVNFVLGLVEEVEEVEMEIEESNMEMEWEEG